MKRAMVTGASEGLGRSFALQLARQGYSITAVARNEERLRSLLQELEDLDLGGDHDILPADLSSEAGVVLCLERIRAQPYQLLINNAGISHFGDFAALSLASQQATLRLNCEAPLVLSHGFLEGAQPGDALINLSSLTNWLPTPVQPVYVATKTFNAAFSQALWYQQRSRGVYVQNLCPGITQTQFMQRSSDLEGFKMRLLDWISESPDAVVGQSLKKLARRSGPTVVPGLGNKLIVLLTRLLPQKVLLWLMGKLTDLGAPEKPLA